MENYKWARIFRDILISMIVAGVGLPVSLHADIKSHREEIAVNATTTDTLRRALKAVEVKGQRVKTENDHDKLYLTRRERKWGTNALDAISALSEFNSSLNGDKLTTIDNRAVTILINGVPSSGMDLRTYKSDEIARVDYYPFSSAKYAMFSPGGPVVDVITRKRRDQYYAAYLTGKNFLNYPNGNDQLSLTYADSLNRVNINATGGYWKSTGITDQRVGMYGQTTQYDGMGYSSKGNRENVTASYFLNKGNNIFNFRAGYTSSSSKADDQNWMVTDEETTKEQKHSEGNGDSWNADAYFRHIWGKKSLSFNVNAFYSKSYDSNEISSSEATILPLANIVNEYRTNTYSIRATGYYSMNVAKNQAFGAGISGRFKHLDQDYNVLSHQKRIERVANLYADYTWRINIPVMVTAYLELLYRDMDAGAGVRSRETVLRPKVSMGYTPSNNFRVRLLGQISRVTPGMGLYNDEPIYQLPNLAFKGNPHFKTYNIYSLTLNGGANTNDYKFIFNFYSQQQIYANRSGSLLKYVDGILVRTHGNFGQSFGSHTTLNLTYNPVEWLSIRQYLEYIYEGYSTPARRVRFQHWRTGGTVSVTYKEMQANVSYNPCTSNRWDGDSYNRNGGQYAFELLWKHKSLSLGAIMHITSKHDNTFTSISDCYWEKDTKQNNNNQIALTFSYSFSMGRERRKIGRDINWNDSDTGRAQGF